MKIGDQITLVGKTHKARNRIRENGSKWTIIAAKWGCEIKGNEFHSNLPCDNCSALLVQSVLKGKDKVQWVDFPIDFDFQLIGD